MDTDRNILFGVLALRAGLVDTEQLAAACDRWAQQQKLPLADLLLQSNGLNGEDRVHVEYLLDRQLARNGNSAKAALAALADAHVRSALGGVRNAELRDWLADTLPGGLYLEPGARSGRGWRTWAIVGAAVGLCMLLGGGASVVFVGVLASRERVLSEMGAQRAEMQAQLNSEQALASPRLDREALDRALGVVVGTGDHPQSVQIREKFLLELLAARQERLDRSPNENYLRSAAADAQEQVAEHYFKSRELAKAEDAFRKAIQLQQALSNRPQALPRARRELARCQQRLGAVLREARKFKEADEMLRMAMGSLQTSLPDTSANFAQYQHDLAVIELQIAQVEKDMGKLQDAENTCNRVLGQFEVLSQQNPQNAAHRLEWARSHLLLGTLQQSGGRLEEAESTLRLAVKLLEQLVVEQPKDTVAPVELTSAYEALAGVLKAAGKEKEAAAVLQKMKKASEKKE